MQWLKAEESHFLDKFNSLLFSSAYSNFTRMEFIEYEFKVRDSCSRKRPLSFRCCDVAELPLVL